MSALGQKQTCAVQLGMSALPPKADMCSALADVRLVPIADTGSHHGLSGDYWARFQATSAVPTVGPKGAVNLS